MKIALVCASDGEGGLEKHVLELAAGLVSAGHAVTLVAPQSLVLRRPGSVAGIAVNFKRPRWWPGLRGDLARALTGDWDVVHAHANKAAQLVAALRARVDSRRWVATLHNEKKDTRAFRRYDEVIVVSQRLRACVEAPKVSVVLNGIVPPAPHVVRDRGWLARQCGLSVDQPILLAIGRLVPAKGFDRLIAAAHEADVQIALVGGGPELGPLQALAGSGKGRVSFLGARADVAELLSACDGLVISSRHEGGPYTLAEALLAECPVLATPVGMVPDVLPEPLWLPEAPSGMAARMLAWSRDPAGWRAACLPAFEAARQRLTLASMIAGTEAAYRGELAPD
ncbi:glycosyltransferase family 4 protein [Aquimonas voraii]|uniref:Glycosyltransferase involved in cell wall bisynthesis n=1 Tax=Aquimonas voraii TaxID=265719 RepID=A0A1G6V079_9GAMM|nr:glycosyltransferase family 4 protein [Aquimonas voraii]SDD46942.1 Glycosyltransferase involved in cell wall bisynthesis [Aquimonas voraii]